MFKRLLSVGLIVALGVVFTGCAENEHKMETKRESQTESTPQDVSPGQMQPG